MIINKRYQIKKILDQEGCALKYLGEDMITKRQVFIKARAYNGLGLPIERELYRQVDHEQIPRLLDTFVEEDIEYIILPWLAGQDGHAYFETGETTIVGLVHIFLQLCQVLMYLHQHPLGIVHRDINLSNMLISPYGRVYLIDFDISSCDQFMAVDDEVSGTVGYVAPETILCPEMSGKQSDIFSLGASLMAAIKKSPKVYSLELLAIAKKAMTVIPAERYASVEEMMKDLNLLL